MSSPSFNLDGRAMLVDALKIDRENFQLSNLILPNKKALEAVKRLYGLQDDLLKFSHDPNPKKEPYLPPMPQEPDTQDLTKEQAASKIEQYERLKELWDVLKAANDLKVPIAEYVHIMNYTDKYKRVLHATPALKGKRFFAFTKLVSDPAKKGGLLDMFGGDKD